MNTIFFSSYCMGKENIEDALLGLVNAGISNIELNHNKTYTSDMFTLLGRFKNKYDLKFLMHNYFPPPRDEFVLNPASSNQTILAKTIAHCKRAIELAGKLKLPVYSLHPGMRLDPHPSELGKPIKQTRLVSYERAYKTLVKSLKMLCDYARDFSVEIAIENNVLAPFNLNHGRNELLLMCESDEFLQLFKDVEKVNLKILVDLGHLKVTSTTLGFNKVDFIDALKDKIILFHLSDNNGLEDTHEEVNEKSWFWDILRNFRDRRYVIESHNLTLEKIKTTKQILQKKLVV